MALRTRLPKILSTLLAVLLTIAAGTGVWIVTLRDRSWAAMERRVEELRAGLNTEPIPRVPLGRSLIPGNAWDDYVRLFGDNALKPIPANIDELLSRNTDTERSETEALIAEHAAWIDKIQKGARRQTAQAPTAGVMAGKSAIVDDSASALDETVSLCLAKARLLAAAGRSRDAVELLLDVCLCGRDLAATRLLTPWRYGLKTMQRALEELQALSARLDPAALQDLERQLALLDEYFPDTSRTDALDHLLFLGELLIKGDEDDQDWIFAGTGKSPRRNWRYFYSTRLEASTAFAVADRLAQEALAVRDLPWTAAVPATLQLQFKLETLDNPAVSCGLGVHVDLLSGRQTRTYLRMVRVAVHYRRTGDVKPLENAQGESIGTKQSEESLLIFNERLPDAPEGSPSPLTRMSLESFLIEVPVRK